MLVVLAPFVLFIFLFFLSKRRVPLIDERKYEVLKVQSKEVSIARPVEGETIPRRHVLFPELLTHNDTVYATFKRVVSENPNRNCLGSRPLIRIHKEKKVVNGESKDWNYFELGHYQWLTYQQAFDQAMAIGSGLRGFGLQPKDVFAIFEETRLEWSLTAQACLANSVAVLTVYANLGTEALVFALNEGKTKLMLTNSKLLPVLLSQRKKLLHLQGIVYTDPSDANPQVLKDLNSQGINTYSFDEVVKKGQENPVAPAEPTPETLAVIMYTSGSTGAPKGVMIKHKNMSTMMEGVIKGLGIKLHDSDVYISYLPLAHILALMLEVGLMFYGVPTGYANPRSLVDTEVKNCKGDLRELQPTLMAGVPTVFDKVKKTAMDKVRQSPAFIQKLFAHAFEQKRLALQEGFDTPFWNRLVFRKVRQQLGGRLKYLLSGGAPISKETIDFLRVCVTPFTIQGYGMTETCGGIALTLPEHVNSPLCVGPPVPSVEVKLRDVKELGYLVTDKPYPRGEVVVRGGNISAGYYQNEAKTKEDFADDGWFATGDVGQWLPDGTLQLIDRKKNIVKLSHGEYIAVERLESIFKNSIFVENACVVAKSTLPYFVLLVQPVRKNLYLWAKARESDKVVVDDSFLERKDVRDEVLSTIVEVGRKAGLKTFELPASVWLSNVEWTPDNSLLTAAMKIKRNELEKHFASQLESMFASLASS
eukprot:TRINITY_DN2740_c0_g2_i2.p1 TRINITY_DN2740_c0_g2~~TRINITY_DN2740_c0_g2_i2.p1  ORF type:complete len:704 (-),score=220.44 TRINITY_DN2740_c0_g2_i2:1198-3309(-)